MSREEAIETWTEAVYPHHHRPHGPYGIEARMNEDEQRRVRSDAERGFDALLASGHVVLREELELLGYLDQWRTPNGGPSVSHPHVNWMKNLVMRENESGGIPCPTCEPVYRLVRPQQEGTNP